jgi:hypothetical protein
MWIGEKLGSGKRLKPFHLLSKDKECKGKTLKGEVGFDKGLK